MTPIRSALACAALAAQLGAPCAAIAQSTAPDAAGGPPPGGAPHGPPPEAIAACKGKTVGAAASFTDRGGRTISGACTQMGDVVAVPPPARGQGGAPPS